jgi:hypothetical protein
VIHARILQLNPSLDRATLDESDRAQKALIQSPETQTLGLGAMTFSRWQTLVNQLADLHVTKARPVVQDLFQWPIETDLLKK